MVGKGCGFLKHDALPFAVMVVVEVVEVGCLSLAKAAMNAGMSNLVYVVYTNALGLLLLLPYYLLHRRSLRSDLPPLNPRLVFRFFILGSLGICLIQVVAVAAVNYSSPSLTLAISNLLPAFTFLIAIFFRMETLSTRASSSMAKCLGTSVAIMGALTMTLYRGPTLLKASPGSINLHTLSFASRKSVSNWVLGGLLATTNCLLFAAWNVLQAAAMKVYPDTITVVFISACFGTVECAILALVTEKNPYSWNLQPSIKPMAVIIAAVTWCLHKKGPLFVTMFTPLGMVISLITGIVFLGDALQLGSLIGAPIIAVGFYTVMWGKVREGARIQNEEIVSGEESSIRTPLV